MVFLVALIAGSIGGGIVAVVLARGRFDLLAYNHAMARLGVAKYRHVSRAMRCLQIAIPL